MKFRTKEATLNYIRVRSGEVPYKKWNPETKQREVVEGQVKLWKLTSFSVSLGKGYGYINGEYWGDKKVQENIINCVWELKQRKYKKFDAIVGIDKEISTITLELKDFEVEALDIVEEKEREIPWKGELQ